MNNKLTKKVTVIGSGFVGSSVAYTLMQSSLISEIVIIDRNKDKATGEAMDLNHGMPFVSPVNIYPGDYSDCKGSDIIIITAGASQKPGETRLDLVKNNTSIFKNIISEVTKYNSDCILLVVTNPVDILTYVTYKLSGFPKNRVIGSGTVLDTARFKYLLGEHIGVDTRNIHGYILGEHGDSEVAAWSLTNVAGIPIKDYCDSCKGCNDSLSRYNIYNEVKNAAYEIIKRKGATFYGVALAIQRIVECIIRNENSILTVSSLLEGQFGLSDVCLSVPTVVNANGIDRILEVPLNDSEKDLLKKSGESLKEIIKDLDI